MSLTEIVTALAVFVPLLIYFRSYIEKRKKGELLRQRLKKILEKKHEERKKQFAEYRSKYKLNDEYKTILDLDWSTLNEHLQRRQLTAKEVLTAFVAKSLEATEFSNAVTEFNPKAFEIAERLDAMDKVKGPLHGMPFCVKDDTNVQGMDSTIGLAKNCFIPKQQSAPLVQALGALGGIPFCKTNLPQVLFSFGSDNPVYGVTTSCHNQKLGPGGSSSGTGALVGAKGTFFGTGTDIGGSVRIPGHCNGVAALKPTPGRLSLEGTASPIPNIIGLTCTPGIIGQNAQIVSSVYKFLLTDNLQLQFDPLTCPIPWDDKVFSARDKKLRIGYFTSQDIFPPIGDTIETVEKAVRALQNLGHTLIPIEIPKLGRFMNIEMDYLLADQGKDLQECWEGEEIAECMKRLEMAVKMPTWILKFVGFLMKRKTLIPAMYSERMAPFTHSNVRKSGDLWKVKRDQIKITNEIIDEWKRLGLDACICPVMPFPAIPVHETKDLPLGTIYAIPWNVTNFVAGVVKFGTETGKNIENYECHGDQLLKTCKKVCRECIGAPIGVQVVGRPFQEELVLRIMEELENCGTNTS